MAVIDDNLGVLEQILNCDGMDTLRLCKLVQDLSWRLEGEKFAPTLDSFETLFSDVRSRKVILRAHVKAKLFSNQLTKARKKVSDKMLTLLAKNVTDPIRLMDLCADNVMSNASDVKVDVAQIEKRFVELTSAKSKLVALQFPIISL